MIRAVWLAALTMVSAFLTVPAFASEHPQSETAIAPITIGVSHRVETHGAQRDINVLLPPHYETDDEGYPLILVLDGGSTQDLFLSFGIYRWNQLWGRSRPAIIVGIETVDRQRELLPPTGDPAEQERYQTAGEADAFRAWIADSVLPMLRERYRHDGRAFIVGESAAGHFVVETWVKTPGLFDGYAAHSPSMQWNNQSLSHNFAALPERVRPPIFVSLADEGGPTEHGALRFVRAAGPELCFADRRESHVRHSNTLHQLLPEALQFLLPTDADWLGEYGMTVNCSLREIG